MYILEGKIGVILVVVIIKTDNWNYAFIYGPHVMVLRRQLSVMWRCVIMPVISMQGILPSYPGGGSLQLSQWDELELVNNSCMQESVIEGVALSSGYSHLPAPVSASFLGSDAAVFTPNILGILFQLVASAWLLHIIQFLVDVHGFSYNLHSLLS
jgi:hypothetical protein